MKAQTSPWPTGGSLGKAIIHESWPGSEAVLDTLQGPGCCDEVLLSQELRPPENGRYASSGISTTFLLFPTYTHSCLFEGSGVGGTEAF